MERLVAGDPEQIGAYRLLARLGTGGMGRVYLARSDRGRTVAVKLVRRELAAQEEFRSRFRQEVAAARRVGGAWTAPVLDADTEAEVPWLATGYVAGPSLHAIVSGGGGKDGGGTDGSGGGTGSSGSHGPLPERSVRILATGLARALQDIHAAGLIHRDLKPSNILVTIDGPRVIDFGIARALETVGEKGLTRTGALMGSPGFMAPEQVRGDRVTAACDVFCLGAVLVYAATGRLPFGSTAGGVPALLFRIAQEEPDLTGVPEGLVGLIRDCLRKDPATRPTTRDVLVRVGKAAGVAPTGEPWLPGGLLAQLGRRAVELLDHEDPPGRTGTAPGAPDGVVEGPGAEPDTRPVPGTQGTTAAMSLAGLAALDPASPPRTGPAPSAHTAPASGGPAAPAPTVSSAPLGLPGPAPAPAPPAAQQPYGYPHPPHPRYSAPAGAFGPPTDSAPAGAFGPPTDGAAPPPPDLPPRSTRATVALVAVAVIVAVGAGGSVYAFMDGDRKKDTGASASGAPTPDGGSQEGGGPTAASPSPSPSAPEAKGAVPKRFVGTWTGTLDTASGKSTRRLVVRQGDVGDPVLALTADGPAEGGTYHCVFEASLASAPALDGPLSIGPSRVTVGRPMSACTPGSPTELTVLGDGTLRRTSTTGESLTYTKSD